MFIKNGPLMTFTILTVMSKYVAHAFECGKCACIQLRYNNKNKFRGDFFFIKLKQLILHTG